MSVVGAILSHVVGKTGAAADLAADRNSQSVAALLQRLTRELAMLLRNELALVSAEFTQALRKTLAAAIVAALGGAALFAGLLAMLAAAILGLSHVMTAWLAALIVGSIAFILGAATLSIGSRSLRAQNLKPHRVSRSLLKDKDVITRKKT
jgi:predicted phage tail protein